MKNFFVGMALVLSLVGCATVNMGDAKQDAALKNFKIAPDKSGVYIYRNETMGAAIKMTVELDGKPIGQTAANTYLYTEVTPGKHTFTSKAETDSTIEVDAAPGTLQYIWQEVKMGILGARSKLQLVDPAQGQKGVQETKLAETKGAVSNGGIGNPVTPNATRTQVAKPAEMGPYKPSKPVSLDLAMIQNRTWTYPHPTDFEKNGDIQLAFSDSSVRATNKTGGSNGTFEIRDGAVCLSLVSWTSYCFFVVEEGGQRMAFFTGRGAKAKLTIN